jgi:hypothetical protein
MVYMPVAAKRRNAVVLEAAMRFPVRRSCRASARTALSERLTLTVLFMHGTLTRKQDCGNSGAPFLWSGERKASRSPELTISLIQRIDNRFG